MATTTPNFGWVVPTSSDLVKNGAVAIETLGDSIDASMVDLKGGTTGQVLSKTTNTDMDFTWSSPGSSSPLTTKGDLYTFSTVNARLGVGANNSILMADSAEATGLKYAGTYTAYTPTVTAGAGTFTTVSATSRYLLIGKLCHFYGRVSITTVGTASGSIVITLPVTRIAGNAQVGSAEETSAVGFGAFVLMNTTTTANILKPDFTTAIGAGNALDFNITYEVA